MLIHGVGSCRHMRAVSNQGTANRSFNDKGPDFPKVAVVAVMMRPRGIQAETMPGSSPSRTSQQMARRQRLILVLM